MQKPFDRSAEDLGNSIHLEHVNVQVPDQRLATLFYVAGLGLTRDPYLMVSDSNMWVNVGKSQLHLPTGKAQVLRGHTALVIPGREALLARLAAIAPKLQGSAFAFSERNDHVEAICPWGNRLCIHEPDAVRFGPVTLGIPLPRKEMTAPLAVPAGTSTESGPAGPSTLNVPPMTMVGKGTGTSTKRSSSSRRKTGCGRTWTTT